MKCCICEKDLLIDEEAVSIECEECGILYNLETEPLDYSLGGGQEIPSKEKALMRLDNASKRFEIILPHKINHNIYVDIGCGSGDMLECSKDFFEVHIGYDENETLIEHTHKKKLNTYKKHFEKKDIKSFVNNGVVLTVNHVLEHVESPLKLLGSIKSQLKKGDLIYVEVPLYTGHSFRSKKYEWSLWYDEHLALYSVKTLKRMASILDCEIVDVGNRNFISDNYNKRAILSLALSNPVMFFKSYIFKKKYHLALDNFLKDYGFIIMKMR